MKDKNRKLLQRFKWLAFWHWEYQSRNPEYRKWSEELFNLKEQLALNESDFPQDNGASVELQESVRQFYQTYAPSIFNEVKGRLDEDPLSLFTPDVYFELRFKRLYREHTDNLNSFNALNRLLKNKSVSFSINNIADLTALIGAYHDWRIEVGGLSPRHLLSYEGQNITSEYSKDDLKTVFHEQNILDVLRMASEEDCFDFVEGFCGQVESYYKSTVMNKKQIIYGSKSNLKKIYNSCFPIEDKQAESFPKVTEGLKGLKEANESRLVGLWLWDNIMDSDSEDLEEGFQEVYTALCAKLDEEGIKAGPWTQYTENDARAKKLLRVTNECIQSMTVLNLGA